MLRPVLTASSHGQMTISGGLPMAMGANECGQLGIDDPNGRPQWTPQMLDKKLRSNIEGSVEAKVPTSMLCMHPLIGR